MKKNKLLCILIILLCITKITYAQNIECYYPLMQEAKLDYENGKYEEAKRKFRDVFISCEDCNTENRKKEVNNWIDSCDIKIKQYINTQLQKNQEIFKQKYEDSIKSIYEDSIKMIKYKYNSPAKKDNILKKVNNLYDFSELNNCVIYNILPHMPLSLSIGRCAGTKHIGVGFTLDLGFKIHDYKFNYVYSDNFENYNYHVYKRPLCTIGFSVFGNLKYCRIGLGIGYMQAVTYEYDPYALLFAYNYDKETFNDFLYLNPKFDVFIPLSHSIFISIGLGYMYYPSSVVKVFNRLTYSFGFILPVN